MRKSKKYKTYRKFGVDHLDNGYPPSEERPWGYIDKSMHCWADKAELSNKIVSAEIGNDFCNGHRGMARAVKGAKKYVRTRRRFHENAATKKLMKEYEYE